jgi:hypothetical protein
MLLPALPYNIRPRTGISGQITRPPLESRLQIMRRWDKQLNSLWVNPKDFPADPDPNPERGGWLNSEVEVAG